MARRLGRRHDEDEDESEEERLESAESYLSYSYDDLINHGQNAPVFVRLVDNPFAIHN